MTIERPEDVTVQLPEQVYRDACTAYWETDGEPMRAAYQVAYLAGRQALADEVFADVVKPAVEAFYASVKVCAALGELGESRGWQNAVEGVISDLADVIGVAEPEWEYMREIAGEAHEGCCTLDYGHDGVCAFVCPDCDGTTNCWVCDGYAGGDDVTWCEGCDGTGGCFTCYEGVVVADA